VTVYSEHIGNTFGPNGFSIGSVSRSPVRLTALVVCSGTRRALKDRQYIQSSNDVGAAPARQRGEMNPADFDHPRTVASIARVLERLRRSREIAFYSDTLFK
jgi:hypothetical protein